MVEFPIMSTINQEGSARDSSNSLSRALPLIASQWHPTLNRELTPENTTPKSAKSVWWLGECGHEWEAKVFNRYNGQGCPYCSGRRLLVGVNDLASQFPLLAVEWSVSHNSLSSEQVSAFSSRKVWWKCKDYGDHLWEATVSSRSRGSGCPYCSNRKVITGFNDLATMLPGLAAEWDYCNNKDSDPSTILSKSTHKVWWQCTDNPVHKWEASPGQRSRGTGCPYCSNRRVMAGDNDLTTVYPDLSKQWHPTKNGLSPEEVVATSKARFWWQCSTDDKHAWEARISARVHGKTGCPYCSKRKVLVGQNDLASVNPRIAAEWHPTKNAGKTPENVSISSGYKAWWVCNKDSTHEWETWVYERTRGVSCPDCSSRLVVSKGEEEVASFLISRGIKVIRNDRTRINGKELDIYLPDHDLAIEFNGLYWHSELFKSKNYHHNKWELCREAGIQLIQIWEDDWRDKKVIVQSMISHKLKMASPTVSRVFARNTHVQEISTTQAQGFLYENHIQGFVSGSHYFGLVSDEDHSLVAVLVLREQGKDLLLARYATSRIVPGGQSKLVKHAEKNLDYRNLITFADLEVSAGALYEKTGFIRGKDILPDYSYLHAGTRQHKSRFRIERFKRDSTLVYEEGLTERQLASLNGVLRIWDSGKVRYLKPHPSLLS